MLEELRKRIKESNLRYLWDAKGEEYTTTKELRVSTHGSDLKNGEFISCLVGSVTIPAGTKGLLFKSQILSYSEYKWLGDMKLPAAGADIILHGTYYSFTTLVKLKSGTEVLADVMDTVRHEPKVVGKLS